MLSSDKTFTKEADSFRDIEHIFWESERAYRSDPFSGILEQFGDQDGLESLDAGFPGSEPEGTRRTGSIRPLRGTNLSILQRGDLINFIGRAAAKSLDEFKESFWEQLGIDTDDELERLSRSGRYSDEGALQALTAKFGVDAFGTYCPWHAYGKSKDTPFTTPKSAHAHP